MTSVSKSVFKTILAVLLGEIVLIVLTTVAQELIYDGISYNQSPVADIFIGGFLTVLAAVFAGLTASFIGGQMNYWPHIFISMLITTEMTYLITTGVTTDPLWFDIFAGLSLAAGVWIGFAIRKLLWFKLS